MAFDLATARPASGGFDLSTAQPTNQSSRLPVSPAAERDLTEEQQLQLIEAREAQLSILPERTKQQTLQILDDRSQSIQELRTQNPELAARVESTSSGGAFTEGLKEGARNLGRALNVTARPGIEEIEETEALRSQKPSFTGGEVVAEAAPFLIPGVGAEVALTKAGAKTLPRVAAQAAIGGAEGGIITAGRGRQGDPTQAATRGEIAQGIITGSLLVGGLEAVGPSVSRLSRSISGKLKTPAGRVSLAKEILKEPTDKEIANAVAGSAPSSKDLRKAAKVIYDDLSEAGIKVSPKVFSEFVQETLESAKGAGLLESKVGRKLTPQASDLLSVLDDMKKGKISFDELEGIRRAAQNSAGVASRAGNNADAAISNTVVDSIDEFMGRINSSSFKGQKKNIGEEVAAARQLWGRARKSEVIDEALERAKSQASGFENGIRIQFKQIINNKKKSRFFTKQELDAMKQVERGTTTSNTLRRIGRMGWGSGKQHTVLNALASGSVGGTVATAVGGPMAGGIGLILLPTVGTISERLATKLTMKGAKMSHQLIRAGDKADDIARVYLRNVPKGQRDPKDLAALLMRPDINLSLVKESQPIITEAVTRAEQLRQAAAASAAIVSVPVAAQEEE